MKKNFPWQILLNWYEKNGKHDFPWRDYSGELKVESENFESGNSHLGDTPLYFTLYTLPYMVWLAEILLQQTQADRVVPFYMRMLEQYPTIHTLARATYDEFFPFYQGLGYYSRARNLLKTAKIINEEYGGIFPRDKSKLRKLPGVGEYTSRAILAFGYGEPLLAWDTNLETIFSRYYKGSKNIKLTLEEKDEIEEDFRGFIAKNRISNPNEIPQKQEIRGSKIFSKGVSGFGNNGEINFSDDGVHSFSGISRNINNALMDWARIREPKNSSLLNRETYIFTNSEFYKTNGANEIIEKKITEYFPIPDAQVIVTLHQDHKIYYSLSGDTYAPFILPPSENRDTRKYVQEYFRGTYGLELSVRPIHKKWITEDGKPYVAVNTQVQAGKYDFHIFTKKAKELQEKNK